MNENHFFSLKQYREQAQKNIDDLSESIKDLNFIFHKKNKVELIKIDICKHLLEKIKFLLNELISNEDNLLNFASTLRFSFESLIHTKMFFKEPAYVLRLRYFLYSHYKEKYSKLIKRVEEEIEMLKEIELFENKYSEKQWANNKQVSIKELDKVIDEKFGAFITMFFEGVKFNGYAFHQFVLQEKVQKVYNNELEKIKIDKENFEKDIVHNKYFQEIFGVNIQPNEVENELLDRRTWNQKANLVNLEKEYSLMYDITSSLIHSTSYSLLTNKKMIEQEKKIYFNLLNQYIKQINENIRLYCLLDLFENKNVKQITLTSDKI